MAQLKQPARSHLDEAINEFDLAEIKQRSIANYVDHAPNWGRANPDDFRFETIVRTSFGYFYSIGLIDEANLNFKISSKGRKPFGSGGGSNGAPPTPAQTGGFL